MEAHKSGKFIVTTFTRGQVTYTVACFVCEGRLEYVKVLPVEASLTVGTILTAKVKQAVNSIPAAFVALDANTTGFLPTGRLEAPILTNRCFAGTLSSGDEMLVQVTKEAIKTKDAVVSHEISVHGQYCIVKNGTGGILLSKQLQRKERNDILKALQKRAVCTSDKQLIGSGLEHVTVTIRAKASEAFEEKILAKDIEDTIKRYQDMVKKASMRSCYTIHHKQLPDLSSLLKEVKCCGFVVDEIITDSSSAAEQLQGARFYQDDTITLSMLYGLSAKIEDALSKRVWLDCGGYLIIEATEAMTVIDVNSGKATNIKNSDELARKVNYEAAVEAARQIRLRNISGIIMIDFINFSKRMKTACEEEVVDLMKELSGFDYSKVTCYEFTKLGLLELTREKCNKPIYEILK